MKEDEYKKLWEYDTALRGAGSVITGGEYGSDKWNYDIKSWFSFFEKNFNKYIKKKDILKILDYGCGVGRFTKLLSDYFNCETVGVDVSSFFIDIAINHNDSSKVKFFKIDFCDLSMFSDNEFDLVFTSTVIQHIMVEELFNKA